MPIPDYQTIMRPLLRQLVDGREHSLKELHDLLTKEFSLTPDEIRKRLPSGRQSVINNRIGWARTYLSKAGLLTIPRRGAAVITERGKRSLEECPKRVDVDYLKRFDEFQEFINYKSESQEKSNGTALKDERTPQEQLSLLITTLNQAFADELLAMVKTTSPEFFEQLVVDLLVAMGYGNFREEAGKTTAFRNDGGIDGTIDLDLLGFETIYIQAKRYTDRTVGRPEVQAFVGALDMEKAKKGVFITTSSFSNEAKECTERTDKKIVLIDGRKLVELMIKHNLGVASKEVYAVKGIDSDYFNEDN